MQLPRDLEGFGHSATQRDALQNLQGLEIKIIDNAWCCAYNLVKLIPKGGDTAALQPTRSPLSICYFRMQEVQL